jgi:7,8-dihydro-6-hydroxymethylpterin dimethyltransferase
VSYFGRFPGHVGNEGRFTLPELMRSLEEQTEGLLKVSDFSPPGCEHAHCSFHATYLHSADNTLRPMGATKEEGCCVPAPAQGGVTKTVETVSRRWSLQSAAPFLTPRRRSAGTVCCGGSKPEATRAEGPLDLDVFLSEAASRSFTISGMAFQDAENLDMERLRGCCISVVAPDGRLIPFCAYNLTARDGRSLYRGRNGKTAP